MTAADLITTLQKVSPDTPITVWDAYSDREVYEIYLSLMKEGTVLICSTALGKKLR